jgi:hypothetical protein
VRNYKLIFQAIVFIMFGTLACAAETDLGRLPADCSPQVFTLKGGTNSIWQATVEPNKAYEIFIEQQDSDYPLQQVLISVNSGGKSIGFPQPDTDDQRKSAFLGPQDGQVSITVLSEGGEDGENLGSFSIKFCEAD